MFGEHHIAENIFHDFDSVSSVLGGVGPDGDAMIADEEGGNFGWGVGETTGDVGGDRGDGKMVGEQREIAGWVFVPDA